MSSISITNKNNGSGDAPASAPAPAPAPTAEASSNQNAEGEVPTGTDDKDLPAEERSLLQKLLRTKLVQSSKQLEIIQKDPTSPLYSATSFEDLPL